jgi:hypothetical protein
MMKSSSTVSRPGDERASVVHSLFPLIATTVRAGGRRGGGLAAVVLGDAGRGGHVEIIRERGRAARGC